MKMNFWMVLTVAVSGSLFAQTDSSLSSTASTATAAAETSGNLAPGPATVTGDNVNVRGQATLRSEVVTRFNKGDTVTVLETITHDKPRKGEPAEWARIAFPTNGHVWVHTMFVDSTNKIVLPKTLNLRAGPGENFSVVGTLQRGDAVNEIVTRGNWMEISPPPDTYAFIAAQYLQQEAMPAPTEPTPAAAATVAEAAPPAPAEPEPAPAIETPVPEQPTVAAPAEPTPGPSEPAAPVAVPAPVPEPAAPAPATAVAEEPPPKRIVQREGIVRPTWSIQAPTPFALVSPDTGETIDYLYTTSTNLNLRRYRGLRIIVTGEEGLDARWKNTPVITIQRIHVVE